MSPKLSIIVPFHNVESYFHESLESLGRQSSAELEVVLVDAASSDNSAVIAKACADADPRFVLVQGQDPDLGVARDLGAQRARGEYLATVGAADSVSLAGFEPLVASLEHSGSDVACGSGAKTEGDTGAVRTVHITTNAELLGDLDVRNKVFRRSFWARHGLTFTEPGVVARAHLLASEADLLDSIACRLRFSECASPRGFAERVALAESVRDVLAERAAGLLAPYHLRVLPGDLAALADALGRADERDQEHLLELGRRILAGVDDQVIGELPSIMRLRAHLIDRCMLPELRELIAPDGREAVKDARIVRRGRFRPRWYARYPFFGDPARAIPRSVYDVTDELTLRAEVDEVRWISESATPARRESATPARLDTLRIEGHAYIDRFDLSEPGASTIRVWLRSSKRGSRIELPVERIRRPDVTASSEQSAVSYDWSGFVAEIAVAALQDRSREDGDDWDLYAEVVTDGLKRRGRLKNPELPQLRWLPARDVGNGTCIQPLAGPEGFGFRVRANRGFVTRHRVSGTTLELDGWAEADSEESTTIVAASRDDHGKVRGRAEPVARSGSGCEFTARLSLDGLISQSADPDAVCEWSLILTNGSRKVKLTPADGVSEARYPLYGREFALTRARNGSLRGVVRPRHPVVTAMKWTDDGRLIIEGDQVVAADVRPETLVLRHRRTAAEREVVLDWRGDCFTAELDPAAMPVLGMARPMRSGTWDLFARAGSGERRFLVERGAIAGLPRARRLGVHEVTVRTHRTDALQLRIRLALAADESGAHAQRRLQEEHYPRCRREPVRDVAVFESYWGKQYSCSPRAIYEEIRRATAFEASGGRGLEYVWSSRDGQFDAPPGSRIVLVGSRRHYEEMARARLIVCNGTQREWFTKRSGQVYVQCWHGTPLKRLGMDVPATPAEREHLRDWMASEVSQWDLLISPNPFTTKIMRQAYEYEGEILECGYPRNDMLKSAERDQIAAGVRRRLGIAAGKRVVLYAPTWRENDQLAPGRHRFNLMLDLDRVRRALSDDHVILVRSHYSATDRSGFREDESIVDVSAYPDMAELSLLADVLVTDYSSSMFDFACTGKPMIFYTYDLERYRDHTPGFYFDFAAESPGPLLRTSDEVIAALLDIDDVAKTFAVRYSAFTEKFCPHDDGHASERAVRRILELSDRL